MSLQRWDVLNAILETTARKRFLEIGVQAGICGARVRAEEKVGVDPDPRKQSGVYSELHKETSDAFFERVSPSRRFDVVLVDGLHHAGQVERDVENSLRHLSDDGAIVMHDCNPQSELAQRVPRQVGVWNGDCWKAMVRLRARPDLDAFTIDADHGVGVVRKRPSRGAIHLPPELSYAALEADRTRLVGLVAPVDWRERFGPPLGMGRLVVACAIFGGRDTPKPVQVADVDEFVLFTDGDGAEGWSLDRSPPVEDPRLRAREIKSRLLEFVDGDLVVWVDGRVRPTGKTLRPLLGAALGQTDVAAYPHPWRTCAYEEALECGKLGLAPGAALAAQMAAYRAAGFPAGSGLWNTMVVARRRTQNTIRLGQDWFSELSQKTLRDQVSFPFVLWKLGMQCTALGPDVYRNGSSEYFIRGGHSGGTRE